MLTEQRDLLAVQFDQLLGQIAQIDEAARRRDRQPRLALRRMW